MRIPTSEILQLTAELIGFRSLSGAEAGILSFLEQWMQTRSWPIERIAVAPNRDNLLVSFGTPRILFTTHVDVVPAPERLFEPVFDGSVLIGRGACDTKGCIATMLFLVEQLRSEGADNFGVLFVVGEEVDGIGAKVAAKALKDRGIEFLINGEPTEGRFAAASKGALDFEIRISGRSCHSGYPDYGMDANRQAISLAQELLQTDFGSDPILGKGLINIGKLEGGSASNVVSDYAMLKCCVRTVGPDNEREKSIIRSIAAEAEVRFGLDTAAMKLEVPAWETNPFIAAYVSDVPNFLPLGCRMYLCGPGSILTAHTDEERISSEEIALAYEQYLRLFHSIHHRQ